MVSAHRGAIPITAYDLAERFVGVSEIPGSQDNPQLLAMLRLDGSWPEHDEVPWCSAFTNYVCWLLRLPRSKSLRARSWLTVGRPIELCHARPGFDVVVLSRGSNAPGPEVLDAPGHVGFFARLDSVRAQHVELLGGNQSDSVRVSRYPAKRVLGVRRLREEEVA